MGPKPKWTRVVRDNQVALDFQICEGELRAARMVVHAEADNTRSPFRIPKDTDMPVVIELTVSASERSVARYKVTACVRWEHWLGANELVPRVRAALEQIDYCRLTGEAGRHEGFNIVRKEALRVVLSHALNLEDLHEAAAAKTSTAWMVRCLLPLPSGEMHLGW